VSERYGLPFMPTTYRIDREGMIVGQTAGPKAWDSAETTALLLSLIHQPQGSRSGCGWPTVRAGGKGRCRRSTYPFGA
jgi:hypothetical protein